MRIWPLMLTLSLFSLPGACERGAPTPKAGAHDHSQHQHAAVDTPAEGKQADEPAGPSIETGSFLLAVAPAASGYTVGKSGELEIALEGRGDWHVNQEYPIRVELKAAPGITLAKNELKKDDAK